jgi:hypothetical protein
MLRGTFGLQTEEGEASQVVLLTEYCEEIKEKWSIQSIQAVPVERFAEQSCFTLKVNYFGKQHSTNKVVSL